MFMMQLTSALVAQARVLRKNASMPLRARHAAVTGALLVLTTGATAQSRFEEDFDDSDKPWQEVAVQLPAPPKPENLVPFDVSRTAAQSFAIDAPSLSVASDGVVRYTLVATSNAGARNISYEGIRCASYERKLYAFGQSDGSWTRSRRDKWELISDNSLNRQHAALAKDYFCEGLSVAGKAEDMLKRMRNKKPLLSDGYR
jgi:hypothetical protein